MQCVINNRALRKTIGKNLKKTMRNFHYIDILWLDLYQWLIILNVYMLILDKGLFNWLTFHLLKLLKLHLQSDRHLSVAKEFLHLGKQILDLLNERAGPESAGTPLTKAYDVTIERYRNSHAKKTRQ